MDMGNTESDTTPVNAEGQGGNQQSSVNFENGLNPGQLRISEAHEASAVLSEIVDLTKANEITLTQVNTDNNYKVSVAQDDLSSLVTPCGTDNSEARANESSLPEVPHADISEARVNKSSQSEVAGSDNSEARANKRPITERSAAASNDDNKRRRRRGKKKKNLKEDDWSFHVKVASVTDTCSSSDTTKREEISLVEECPAIDGQVKAELGDLIGDQAIDASCSTSIKHQQCQPCSFDDEEREASGFCVNCLEYICNDCSRDQRRNKITRDHVVLKGDEMPEDSTQFAKIKNLMKCPLHAENDISFECKDHGNLICVSCFTENHRKCEHVLDIAANEDAKEFMMQAQLNQFEVLKTKCRILSEKKESDRNVLIKERQELEDKGRALAAELREHLAELEA
ncbi:hypothetical protein DPMN_135575 [Dreissena polymorpha]|uniref:B box-type domain-containing protein n=1 Tax=Dreissena polymorpha TaxID=45954 RepID=A0A9D4G268_DREPO|nr:hypothetical protein DPMN_135575 [Dreissena polymorpha]